MADLFENDEVEVLAVDDSFGDLEVDVETGKSNSGLDARRRLENLLEEKRLQDELGDDFVDF